MKVAIVYNRESKNVINLFGNPNQEKIGLTTIRRLTDALRSGGHQVTPFEADKDLIRKLEEFMPSVVKGERPGIVFNVSYGLQGQARYTHVPSILEMVGVPYVASGPLAHSLALDKVVAKMVFDKSELPTPPFCVLHNPEDVLPALQFPVIVKPKDEAVSFGVKIANDEDEVRQAASVIFERFRRPVLVEQYIDGREVNVGILGNNPPEALPPVELVFGEGGPAIYTYEDKTRKSGREIHAVCPAPLGDELTHRVQQLAVKAFEALGCYDCARVDMRIDRDGNPYLLEINSLPSLGEHGSYVEAAEHAGLDYPKLVNRLVEVASARYFGTPLAPLAEGKREPSDVVFQYVTQRRDRIERRIGELAALDCRTADPVGLGGTIKVLDERFQDIGLVQSDDLTDKKSAWAWRTKAGIDDGTLLVAHVDLPIELEAAHQPYRRDPSWLFGEGAGSVHAPLVMVEYALRALKAQRALAKARLGVLLYTDEGRDCRYSGETIARAAAKAKRVLVLRCASSTGKLVTQRRGLRSYRLIVDGPSRHLGQTAKTPAALPWTWRKLDAMVGLSSQKERVAVTATEIKTSGQPMRLPHRVSATVLLAYPDSATADAVEGKMRDILDRGDKGCRWQLESMADRPAMADAKTNRDLARQLQSIADRWEIPLGEESSSWPSAAGLVPQRVPVVCGLGPIAKDIYTAQECVQRMSLLQRTLLLSQFLLRTVQA